MSYVYVVTPVDFNSSAVSCDCLAHVYGGQDVGGVGALRGAFAHQSGLLETGQREVEEAAGAVVFGETAAEVGEHAVVEAGVVQLHGHGVFEVDPAADRLGGLPVRQARNCSTHTVAS